MATLPLQRELPSPLRREAAPATAIAARGLCRVINDTRILDNIHLAVPAGSFVGILGPNGAGKSTLLNLLSTLTTPSAGELHLLGQAVNRGTALRLRGQIGLIGHQPMLYRHLSARENLEFFGGLHGVPNTEKRATELLTQVGLLHRADSPVATFSRGMVQRIAIARALMHDPALILADEPFAGLDVPSVHTLEATLADLHRQGKTIVMTNHDIAQSLRLTERVIVLRRGTVVADWISGDTDETQVLAKVTS
jgi:heme exporter protein A